MSTSTSDFRAQLTLKTQRLGFDCVGICRADEAWLASDRLERFVEAGYHAQMGWMKETLSRRRSPTALWPEARSAVVVGLNYGPSDDPMSKLTERSLGNISVYAQGKDYHDVLKKRLKQLARDFVAETGAEVKVFVDTAPLMEKPLAQKAGLGWQGKHTNLVSRDLGAWLFLGVMLTNADLAVDAPEVDHCGSCRACLDICPTAAFPAPYQLDARRCLSYLTIEHKGAIPVEFRTALGNRIYGCDDCLAICPWNKFSQLARQQDLWARAELKRPNLGDLSTLDDATFREIFSGSPVKRIGRNRFVRNVLLAIANSADPTLVDPYLLNRVGDRDPVVRGAAVWALAQLDPSRFMIERPRHLTHEGDPEVRAEWQRDPAL